MSWYSQWSLSFCLSHQYPICMPLLTHSGYMPRPSHLSWLDHSNYTWRRVQVTKLLIMQYGCETWSHVKGRTQAEGEELFLSSGI
jgi:hypothetical protein